MNNPICPCVFIKKKTSGFVIIAVYVDDLNIIETQKKIKMASDYLKRESEMKDLGRTQYCLGLQIEHSQNGMFVHQPTYTKRVLKWFNMDKSTPLSIRWSLDHLILKVIHFDHLRKIKRYLVRKYKI